MALIAIFAGVILVLLVAIAVIVCRRKCPCCLDADLDKDQDKASGSTESSGLPNNVVLQVNHMDQMSNGSSGHMKHDLATTPSLSNEADSAWEGSDNQDGYYRNNTTALMRENSDLDPNFPPKPVSPSNYYKYQCVKYAMTALP